MVAYFVVLAICFALVTPPFEAPDETGHLFYINHVATTASLPDQNNPDQMVVGEGHQFPLYYMIAAIPVRLFLGDNSVDLLPVKNLAPESPGHHYPKFLHLENDIFAAQSDQIMFYALRGYSILLGVLTVLLTYQVAAALRLSDDARLLATGLVATLPQFLFISSSINNDNLVVLAATAAIYLLVRFTVHRSSTLALRLGVTIGVAVLSKKSGLFLLPALAIPILTSWRHRVASWRTTANYLILAAVIATTIASPVFARNQILYGDSLGTEMERQTLPMLVDEKPLWDAYWLDPFLPEFGKSFVGVFGWMNVFLPDFVYWFYVAVLILSTVGLVHWIRAVDEDRWRVWAMLGLIGLCFSGVIYYNLTYSQYQGRFLFPVITPIAILVALGLLEWKRTLGTKRSRTMAYSPLVIALIGIDVVSLVVQWLFHYRPEQYLQ